MSEYWLAEKCAVTTGPIKYGEALGKLAVGDHVFAYESKLGVVLIGEVSKEWDRKQYARFAGSTPPAENRIFKIGTNWTHNLLDDPITAKKLKAVFSINPPLHAVQAIKQGEVESLWHFVENRNPFDSAISDLEGPQTGGEIVDRASSFKYIFKRDPKIREYVVNRAEGKCEYCGKQGFQTPSGKRYLEAHHIIALSEQGPDTLSNVIALCPEHHRQAHYGKNGEKLESEFQLVIAKLAKT